MTKVKFPTKRPGRAAAIPSHLPSKPSSKVKMAKKFTPLSQQVEELKSEVELLTSYSSDTIYRLRFDTMAYDYISPSVAKLLGFSAKEMRAINFRSLILETRMVTSGMRSLKSFDDLEQKRKAGDVSKWQADYLMRTKDGRKIWVSDVSYPWFDMHGNIVGSVGSLRDITERVVAEDEVREELSKIANTDALTGLTNRRAFFDELEREIRRVQRTNMDVSMLLLDIDHFKGINDSYGHDIGDRVLVEVGQIILSCLRETDMASRIGGEEFAVLLPDTPADGAYWVAERIRMQVMKHDFQSGSDAKPVSCTVSIGVSSAAMGDEIDASGLYKVADTRLYIAKNTGRNQVSVDEILHTH